MKKRSLLRYTLPTIACVSITNPATHSAPSFLHGSLGVLFTGLTCLVMQGRQTDASYAHFVNRSKVFKDGRIGNDIIRTSNGNLLVAQLYEEDERVAFQLFDTDGTSLLIDVVATILQSVLQTSQGSYIGVGTVLQKFSVLDKGFCGFGGCTIHNVRCRSYYFPYC